MNTLIVYESMFGNTRRIGEAIADALRAAGASVTVTTAAKAPVDLTGYDRVVIGAPTHAHSLPQPSSRKDAATWAEEGRKELTLEPGAADESGVREWLQRVALAESTARFASFSTRADFPLIFAGDAAAAIKRRLRKRGVTVDAHEDFRVDFDSHLLDGEAQRAGEWATTLIPVAAGRDRD
ncbi:flavodoxin family protein [Microbacterium sp.]|uniref:flavodoxin family protein n=1 Tax=Microbacterium sp. TaxID=51671 RepID=UPI002E327875|nr:flavodoxin domain-containing protein [Microbacterium sp.]HEX5728778.1 flavodoxin domain-containing protein [Microbacterium sp.]